MKILLISPPRPEPLKWGKKIKDIRPVYLPLGLAYIGAASREAGCEVRVLDFNVIPFVESEFVSYLLDYRPDVVGVQILVTSYRNSKAIAKIAKETLPDVLTVVGGPHASVYEKQLLEESPMFDVVAVGEADITFPELIKTFESGGDFGDVAGICFRKDGEPVYNGFRLPLPDLDALPLPARDLFPRSGYRMSPLMLGGKIMDLITSRGCPFRCSFCHAKAISPGFRAQSPRKTIEEIKTLRSEFRADSLLFHDDILTANKKNTLEMCGLMVEENTVLPWSCLTHVNCLDEELIIRMKQAGCYQIWFGVESGSQRLLDMINKNAKLETVREVFALCNKHRIMTHALFIIGLPGETRQETRQTIDFAVEINSSFAQFSLASPLKGTAMHEQMKDESAGLGRIIDFNEDNYDIFSNIVYVPAGRTAEELRASYRLAYRKFYLRLGYFFHILPYLAKYPPKSLYTFVKTGIKQLLLR